MHCDCGEEGGLGVSLLLSSTYKNDVIEPDGVGRSDRLFALT